uniref:Uncharacterized protein n=1 Tax=Timema douglasi TaxID=61478 RepID=A0A7R8VTE3_TIMDO|nr:unnamed protein product [Timema douglasi]
MGLRERAASAILVLFLSKSPWRSVREIPAKESLSVLLRRLPANLTTAMSLASNSRKLSGNSASSNQRLYWSYTIVGSDSSADQSAREHVSHGPPHDPIRTNPCQLTHVIGVIDKLPEPKRYLRDAENPVKFYSDREFIRRFRFSKDTVVNVIVPLLTGPNQNARSLPVPPLIKLRFSYGISFGEQTGKLLWSHNSGYPDLHTPLAHGLYNSDSRVLLDIAIGEPGTRNADAHSSVLDVELSLVSRRRASRNLAANVERRSGVSSWALYRRAWPSSSENKDHSRMGSIDKISSLQAGRLGLLLALWNSSEPDPDSEWARKGGPRPTKVVLFTGKHSPEDPSTMNLPLLPGLGGRSRSL